MLKKLISVAAAVCVSVCQLVPAALGAEVKSSFSDMSANNYGWAVEDVESMTRLGIIKGYSDGTFKPGNNIKKIEMLLLLSRAAGYSDRNYAPFTEFATALYSDYLEDYEISYKPEVSFLLYKGIISTSELDGLLTNANDIIKRYETAVLLTKLMGAEEQVQSNIAASLDYADYGSIPASARTYVEYVTDEGIMTGVGSNNFDPMGNITRAQAAVILSRVLKKLNLSTVAGTVTVKDTDSYTLDIDAGGKVTRANVKNKLIVDGEEDNISSVRVGSQAIVLYKGSNIASVEVLSTPAGAKTYSVTLVNADIQGDSITLTVETDKGEEMDFLLVQSHEPKITLDGKRCDFYDLSPNMSAVIAVSDNEIASLAAVTGKGGSSGRTKSVSGIITYVDTDEKKITFRTGRENKVYSVSSKAEIEIYGDESKLGDLFAGAYADIDFSGSTVTYIYVDSEADVDYFEYGGYINSVDLTKGDIEMDTDDGTEDIQLILSGKTVVTTVIDGATGSSLSASKLKRNQEINVIGVSYDKDNVASVIIIMP